MNFENIMDNVTQGIAVIIDLSIVYCNDTFANDYGLDKTNVIDKNITTDLCEFVDVQSIIEVFAKFTEDNNKTHFIYDALLKSGVQKKFQCIVSNTRWDHKDAIFLCNVDISDEYTHLVNQENMLHQVANNINIGLIRISNNSDLIYANQYLCEIFEQEVLHLEGQQYLSYFLNKAKVLKHLNSPGTKSKNVFEAELFLDDGIKKWLEITLMKMTNGTGYVGTIKDITNAKQVLPELLKLRDELKRERVR